jgi:hypothetical protein
VIYNFCLTDGWMSVPFSCNYYLHVYVNEFYPYKRNIHGGLLGELVDISL